jgi:hypothetical protein
MRSCHCGGAWFVAGRMEPVEEKQVISGSLQVAENVTLWTVIGAISLFTAGEITHLYEMESLGVRALRADVAWQDRVFEGGVAVINEVFTPLFGPSLGHLPWIFSAVLFAVALWRRKKSAGRPRLRAFLTVLALLSYGSMLINIGIHWGRTLAEFIREPTALHEHYVFTPDAVPRLPAGLVQDNEKRALRLVGSTADFMVIISGDRKTVYKVAVRDIEVQEATREK